MCLQVGLNIKLNIRRIEVKTKERQDILHILKNGCITKIHEKSEVINFKVSVLKMC